MTRTLSDSCSESSAVCRHAGEAADAGDTTRTGADVDAMMGV
jgi:hypothetical protein